MLTHAPEDLAAWTGGSWSRRPEAALRGFAIDSRRVRPGDVFVALKTGQRDGHDYVGDAFAAGASAAIVARAVTRDRPELRVADPAQALRDCARAHRARFAGPVVGLTGSCGKTSTKDLLHRLLGFESTLATEGNLNNTLGVPLTLLRLDPARHTRAVIEAGINQPGEMAVLAEMIAPTHGIVTMVGLAHAEALGGTEGIAREKARLLAAVPDDGMVFFPADCTRYAPFNAMRARARLIARSATPPPPERIHFCSHDVEYPTDTRLETDRDRQRDRQRQYRQTVKQSDREGMVLTIALPALTSLVLPLPPMTEGMVSNVVLAVSTALALGVPEEAIRERLTGWTPSASRGEIRTHGAQVFYVDCYNANPSSTLDALRFFARRFASEPKLYVLGSMRELGDFREAAHREVGAALRLGPGDQAAFIGEDREALRTGAEAVGNPPTSLHRFPATEAARALVAGFEGAILLKGSRAYALETLLPAGAAAEGGEGIAC
jgi:UDP-N-acetylmuramoyl-tripeptide--D-alanyl-D-alanine ligase